MSRRAKRAFTLLEVILALAIMAGSIAVIGESVRYGVRNAEAARDLTRAELLCESKMAEITAGIVLPEPVSNATLETDPRWYYSIALEPLDHVGLVALRVTVGQGLSIERQPVEFSLVRWIRDPSIAPPAETTEETTSSSSSSTTTSP